MEFAKLFDTAYGQLLVFREVTPEGKHVVRVIGAGGRSFGLFARPDADWQEALAAFDQAEAEQWAFKLANPGASAKT